MTPPLCMDSQARTTRPEASSHHGRRVRDFRRVYKACELCRRKKIKCVVDGPGTSCLRCQRELSECIFSPERSHRKRTISTRPAASTFKEADSMSASSSPVFSPQRSDVPIPEQLSTLHTGDGFGLPLQYDAQDSSELPAAVTEPQLSGLTRTRSIPVAGAGDLTDSVMRTLVSNGNDAMKILFQAATEHARIDGDTAANDPLASRALANMASSTASPENIPSVTATGPIYFSPASYDILKVWRAFRFTRMGWFTAQEAITYVDLFSKNLAPLSPVSRDFDLSHGSHFKLITQEPLLCSVILMISTRYHILPGTGGVARNTILHHRLWEHCQHLVMRIMFGQEKRSKAKTRTKGSIEALLLMIEWHPRAIHFPPASDGWDSSLIISDFDPRDDEFGNQADTTESNEARWLGDVVAPAKTADRMAWMLLGCAQSLALELGLCDAGGKADPTAAMTQPPGLQAQKSRLCELLYIFMEQHSSRLGCPSMVPAAMTRLLSEPSGATGEDSAMMTAWLDLTNLLRTITDVLFPSATGIRELLGGCRYVNIIKHFQQQLMSWKITHLRLDGLSPTAFEVLSIEYHHLRAFMNSLGIQAVVDRVLGRRPPDANDTEILQSSITTTDYAFIKEVIDGSCQTLESVNRLFDAGTLRCSPIRIFLRIITASIFLLKALSLGTRTADFEASLAILERSIEALRASSLDEMHLAARYGELLATHLAKFRQGMVPASIPRGIPTAETNGRWDYGSGVQPQQLGEGLVDLSSLDTVSGWLALPFDASIAPFGFSGNVPDLSDFDDRSWDLLWNLPNV
ncbi:hypothetical protein B0J13DRAFT_555417 [Dactylonectria estremocensis]|uniref:Zn(2)-C6 fungal-type domain-containing protein n=1 Tax=Dactylonectria estremocensis TaxID=1079267 RepID=A0A9P9EU51_9HYPO|nr:hypothetical protein B0J13DRAFT_555417 [Dactylonectria estremocensis]